MFAVLLLLFVVVPLVELYVIIQVGQAIGAVPTIALVLAVSVLGSMLMRSQGRAAWRRFQAAVAEGRTPAREVLDGVLVIFGGAFLLTPGFVTDVVGVVLLLPPTRALVRRGLVRRLLPRMAMTAAGRGRPRRGRPADADSDVEGTAVEIERDRLP